MTLRGQWDIKFKKWIAGSEMAHSIYTGPGEVLLAPSGLGDVMPMRFNNDEEWYLGKECFLASTSGIKMMLHRQKLSQAVFSGEGLFVYKVEGQGIVWTQSFGAIIKKELVAGEEYFVDNGHLVAWTSKKYRMERAASGGIFSAFGSKEGLVCRFFGPATVYIQTRNLNAFGAAIGASTASG
ncbi:uncharacterized protein PFLUO_LOCUS410 [Penicillium psychrofluorescens]|uniref:uncharacterized protein n=1 Tax=Penicillium psychrofluorescens TaxID=3158075 RepID=UPI003CCCCF27